MPLMPTPSPRRLGPAALAFALAGVLGVWSPPVLAGSTSFNCANSEGDLTREMGPLSYRKDEKVEYEVLRRVPIQERERVCETAGSRTITVRTETYLEFIRFSLEGHNREFEDVLLCTGYSDNYPNIQGADTTCVKEYDAIHLDAPDDPRKDMRSEEDKALAAAAVE